MAKFQLCKYLDLHHLDTRGFVINDLNPSRNIFVIRDNEKICLLYTSDAADE